MGICSLKIFLLARSKQILADDLKREGTFVWLNQDLHHYIGFIHGELSCGLSCNWFQSSTYDTYSMSTVLTRIPGSRLECISSHIYRVTIVHKGNVLGASPCLLKPLGELSCWWFLFTVYHRGRPCLGTMKLLSAELELPIWSATNPVKSWMRINICCYCWLCNVEHCAVFLYNHINSHKTHCILLSFDMYCGRWLSVQ